MRIHPLFAIVIACITLPACNPRGPKQLDMAQVRKSVEAQNAKWIEAMKQHDIKMLVSLYTDDATILPPNTQMLKGLRQIKASYERMYRRGTKMTNAALITLDVTGEDSTVFEIGQYFMTVERQDAPTISDTGKYSTIWKLQPDGSWKMHIDCWNSNKPLRLMQTNQ